MMTMMMVWVGESRYRPAASVIKARRRKKGLLLIYLRKIKSLLELINTDSRADERFYVFMDI